VRAEILLSLRDVSIAFGGVHAVEGVSFDVPEGAIVSLIGPNGAGKTTLLNSVSGFVKAAGSIRFRDVELIKQAPHRRAGLGIGRTFQNLQLFHSMTLLDNIIAGQHVRLGGNILQDIIRFPIVEREREAHARGLAVLSTLGIERYAHRRVGGLPFGVQKLAGVARALAPQPVLLLLDEPAAGLNRKEADTLGSMISSLRQELGVTILLVEHNMRLVMGISDHVVVLDDGMKLTEGSPREVIGNAEVIEAYLGLGAHAAPEVPHDGADNT
jgi:branched-chain amino acid transport system ATP-binding protein